MKIWVVFKRELGSYFNSPIAYVFMVTFLALTGYYFTQQLFTYREAEMRPLFQLFPLTFLFIVPAVSMRIWAEEKKSGTFEMILTLPMSDAAVVWGKFLAGWAFLSLAILFTLPFTYSVSQMSTTPLDWSPIWMGYLASLFLAGAYLAVGSFLSSLTKNQIIAFILTVSTLGVLLLMSQDLFLHSLQKTNEGLAGLIYYLSFAPHFESISRGILDLKDMIYFGSVIVFFMELNRLSVAWRD